MNTPRTAVRRAGNTSPPVVVIGISGATWTVIEPMIAEGALPNFRRLMREGSWGILQSVKTGNDRHYRPQTAWPSLLTGKRPEGHGITEYFHTCRNMVSPGIWEYFNARGQRAGLFSTPVLWPPPRIDGFVIPAPHGRDDQAWPEDLAFIMQYYRHHQDSKLRTNYLGTMMKSLKFAPILLGRGQDPGLPFGLIGGAVRLAMTRDRETRALILRKAKLEFSTAIFLWLHRRYAPGFSIFTSFEVDYVSHRYWRYHEPEKFSDSRSDPPAALKRAVRDAYANMDRCAGLLLKRLPPECTIAVVSEHGMAAETVSPEIGRWQYLINGGMVKSLAEIGDEVVAVPIARWLAFRRRDQGPLDGALEKKLRDIVVVESGLPLFSTHFHARDEIVVKLNIHRGDYEDLDDIGILHISAAGGAPLPIGRVLDKVGPRRSAMHVRDGVVMLKGRGIRAGFEIGNAVITDIMPTLLAASGIEVPPGLDGRVLEVFS